MGGWSKKHQTLQWETAVCFLFSTASQGFFWRAGFYMICCSLALWKTCFQVTWPCWCATHNPPWLREWRASALSPMGLHFANSWVGVSIWKTQKRRSFNLWVWGVHRANFQVKSWVIGVTVKLDLAVVFEFDKLILFLHNMMISVFHSQFISAFRLRHAFIPQSEI